MEWKIIEQTTQKDDVQRVQVEFTDAFDRKHRRSYDFPSKSNVATEINIRSAHVEQGLKDSDICMAITNIESGVAYKLEYATATELKTKLVEITDEKQTEIDVITAEKSKIDSIISVGEK